MKSTLCLTACFLLFSSSSLAQIPLPHPWRRASADTNNPRKVPPEGYYNPSAGGGKMLTDVPGTYPAGLGEPLNAILAGTSDPDVLVDSEVNGGLRNYFLSFGFSGECLGQHEGSDQSADLGDGNGYLSETSVIRWDYGDPELGTCKETIQGGNHFRYWVQNGPQANSGAVFMACSYEMPIAQGHDIIENGYNLARDWLVGNITQKPIPTALLTNTSTYTGETSSENYTYRTSIQYVSGLLLNTSVGINHQYTVGQDGVNAVDGLVAVLEVSIVGRPAGSPTNSAWRSTRMDAFFILPLLMVLLV